jgi:hypothetical protein
MRHELWYTSAPRGLDLGSSGYCTVKVTRGMSPLLREVLERMSQYRHLFPPGHKRASENPVVVSCVSASIGGNKWRILSRICDAGADHTNRTNFFAHHIAYDAAEGPRDPAWLASLPNTFAHQWDHRTEELVQCRELPKGTENLRPCAAWQAVCGDAGWAGAVADAILEHTSVYLISNSSRSTAPLIREVASLLPITKRSELTFSTQYRGSSTGMNCQLRCVTPDSEEAKRAVESGLPVFDLAAVLRSSPPETPRVAAARTGILNEPPTDIPAPSSSALPESFINRTASALPQPRPSRAASTAKKWPESGSPSVELRNLHSSPSDSDVSRAWMPVLSGLGGVALCALVLSPFILWYRGENRQQQASITQLNERIEATNSELKKQKEQNAAIEKDRDSLEKKLSESTHESKMGQIKSEQQANKADTENEKLKQQNADLEKKLKLANAAQAATQKTAESPATQNSAPVAPVTPHEAPKPETLPRLPPPAIQSRDIDVIPDKPSKVEIRAVPEIQVVQNQNAWDIKVGSSSIAKFIAHGEKPNVLLRFRWEPQAANRADTEKILEKLNHTTAQLTFENGKTLDIPLYYLLPVSTPPAPPAVKQSNGTAK